MFTTLNFVRNALPGGKAPNGRVDSAFNDLFITIPYAVMAHSDGLDYSEDENGNEVAYFDDYPYDYVDGAFLTKEEAEAHVAANSDGRKYPLWIEENHNEPLWAFHHLYWEGKKHYTDELLTEEEAKAIEARIVRTNVKSENGYDYERLSLT